MRELALAIPGIYPRHRVKNSGWNCRLIILYQLQAGFLSDVQNTGMYEGEMLDGQPHGLGTIIYLSNDKFGRENYTG